MGAKFAPWTKPTKYRAGMKKGFILFPHSNSEPDGWGEPYKDEDGNYIEPGTYGGPNPNVYIGVGDQEANVETLEVTREWEKARTIQRQVAGPIDWKGPYLNPDALLPKRYVLSYWGPSSRYFNNGSFSYGSDIKHQEIYQDGKMLSIAPFPVLGAAVQIVETGSVEEGNYLKTKYLVAICKDGDEEICFLKPYTAPITVNLLTDELREAWVKKASTEYPNGWKEIGRAGPVANGNQISWPPETPWFFNESGTEARTMRRCPHEWNTGLATDNTDSVFLSMQCRISFIDGTPTAGFTNLGLGIDDYFDYIEETEKYRREWDYLGDPNNRWQEDIYENYTGCIGQMTIAVDFIGDDPVFCWWDQNLGRTHIQVWEWGIGSANSGRSDGENVSMPPGVLYDLGSFGVKRMTSTWVGADERVYLRFGKKVGVPEWEYDLQFAWAGSKSALAGVPDENDAVLYFFEGLYTYLHHLDLRTRMIVGYSDLVSTTYSYPNRYTSIYKMEHVQNNVDAGDPMTGAASGDTKIFMNAEVETVSGTSSGGWSRATMETWPITISEAIYLTTYKGGWMYPNESEALYAPDPWTFWEVFYATLEAAVNMQCWPIEKVLFDAERAVRNNMVAGVTEDGDWICHMEYNDIIAGSWLVDTKASPEVDLTSLIGYGDRYFPGGVF